MTGLAKRVGSAVCFLLFVNGPVAAAQAVGNVSLGASIIEYDGFVRSGAAVLAPSVQFTTPRLSMSGQGSWTVFESGNGVGQATAGLAWLAGTAKWWRVEVSGSAGAAKYAREPASGHLVGGARFHLVGAQTGGWIGVTTGAVFEGRSTVAPVEVTAAGWHVRHGLTLVGAATMTRFDAERFVDLTATARWAGPRLEVEARVGIRPWARVGIEQGIGYGELTAFVPVSSRLALTAGGGSRLADPIRRTLGAKYFSAGVRLRAFGPAEPVRPQGVAALLGRLAPADPAAGRLEIAGSGAERIVRVHAPGVASVDLMADFTDWGVVALVKTAPGVWEIRLPIGPGVYRLNLRFDGGPWIVPTGTQAESSEFGRVGRLIVGGPPG